MRVLSRLFCAFLLATSYQSAQAQFLQALSSFGGGDGWLAPGELGFNGVEATVRGRDIVNCCVLRISD